MSGTAGKIVQGDLIAGGVSVRGTGKLSRENAVAVNDHETRITTLEGGGGGGASEIDDLTDAATTASSLALGSAASASGASGTAVGIGAVANGDNSVAVGNGASSSALEQCTTVGQSAESFGDFGTAVGYDSQATQDNGTAIGWSASASTRATAVATSSGALSDDSCAYGSGATVSAMSANSVCIGAASQLAMKPNTFALNLDGGALMDNTFETAFDVTASAPGAADAYITVIIKGSTYRLPLQLAAAAQELRQQLVLDSDLLDSTAFSHDGALTGNTPDPTFANSGADDYAVFTFTSANDAHPVCTPNPLDSAAGWGGTSSPYTGNGWTVSIWVNAQSVPAGNDGIIWSVGNPGTNVGSMGFSVVANAAQVDYQFFKWAGGSSTLATRNTNVWTHLVVAFDEGTEQLTAYVDGGAGSIISLPSNGLTDGTICTLGGSVVGNVVNFGLRYDGFVDDLRVYNYPLTPGEVTAVFGDRQ